MSEEFELICSETGERIDRFLSGRREDLSRSYKRRKCKGKWRFSKVELQSVCRRSDSGPYS